jgi:hypothetical protein
MLSNIDKNNWILLENKVAALRLTQTNLTVFAIAHDEVACENLFNISSTIPCWYDGQWALNLRLYYNLMNKKKYKFYNQKHGFMLGRLGLSLTAVCGGYNVFVSDADAVYYEDPLRYVLPEADIMIAMDKIPEQHTSWGGYYLTDKSNELVTLNSDVAYYRSSDLVRAFIVAFSLTAANSLSWNHDPQKGFLQMALNNLMKQAQPPLKLFPYGSNR